ncbi:hypothetical protein FALBO_13302 [Fusarium albosuccineum]|uniref:Uncharacterized protein n=1 Tax=Fusarium albosuccineum TaxID=1237068 RepID=A0A8H4P785_9HYPO|nr:hypothetical protein FALBO_13302 [Fusarium albosuccineum]
MTPSNWASPLRNAISRWHRDLETIKQPSAALQEETAMVWQTSRAKLEEFALDPSRIDVSILQQQLLSDGRHLKEIELQHTATIAIKQQLYDEALESLARRIVQDLVHILGASTFQGWASASLPLQEQPSEICHPDTGNKSQEESVAEPEEGPPQPHSYNTRHSGRIQRLCSPEAKAPSQQPPSPKRKRGVDSDNADTIKLRHSAAFLDCGSAGIGNRNERIKQDKKNIRKRSHTLEKKSIEFGADFGTACILVYKNPLGLQEWVCAAHVSAAERVPSIDIIV